MKQLATVIESVLLGKIMSASRLQAEPNKIGWGLTALSTFLLCIGSGLMIYALYLTYQTNGDPGQAAAFAGGIAIAASALIVFAFWAYNYIRRTYITRMRDKIGTSILDMLGTADDEVAELIRNNPKLAVGLATFVGYVMAEKISG